MGPLVRARLSLMIGLAVAGLGAGQARADDPDAYYPAAGKDGPMWERPRFTQFSATRCSSGAVLVDQIQLNREDASDTKGSATYTDATRAKGSEKGAGGWVLAGDVLTVKGDGFALEGRWIGAILMATITRPGGGEPVRCRYQVAALRSFTQYQ
jgi:hypothetical protein